MAEYRDSINKSSGSVNTNVLYSLALVTQNTRHTPSESMFGNDSRPQFKRNSFHPIITSQYMSELTSKTQIQARFIYTIEFVLNGLRILFKALQFGTV
jgi:hypothetical protein